MRRILALGLVFMGAVLLDSVLLPSLFHLYGGLLGFVFLACLPIIYGDESNIIILGALGAFLLELWHGFYFGSLVLSWLVAILTWRSFTNFLNLGPSIKNTYLDLRSIFSILGTGYLLVAVMSVAFLLVGNYLYRADASWLTLKITVLSGSPWLISGLGIIACALLMRLSGRKSLVSSGKFYI